jgi:hypothetical protein
MVWHGNSLRAGAAGSMAAGVQPRAVAGPPFLQYPPGPGGAPHPQRGKATSGAGRLAPSRGGIGQRGPEFGVVPVVAVGSLVIAALAAAVLVAANALAAGPALLAARSGRPGCSGPND